MIIITISIRKEIKQQVWPWLEPWWSWEVALIMIIMIIMVIMLMNVIIMVMVIVIIIYLAGGMMVMRGRSHPFSAQIPTRTIFPVSKTNSKLQTFSAHNPIFNPEAVSIFSIS